MDLVSTVTKPRPNTNYLKLITKHKIVKFSREGLLTNAMESELQV
jgi:hypothetical protein